MHVNGGAKLEKLRAGIFDITDGPPFGSCSVDTAKALLRHSPDLTLPDTVFTRIARVLGRSPACAATFALIRSADRP